MSMVYREGIGPGSSLSTFANNQLPLPLCPTTSPPSTTNTGDLATPYPMTSKAPFPALVLAWFPGHTPLQHNRVDLNGDRWYKQTFANCYLGDFLWGTAMQTERKQLLHWNQFQDRDKVVEALINCSICDKTYPDLPNLGMDRTMCHLSSMVQQLLVCIENLETQICSRCLDCVLIVNI